MATDISFILEVFKNGDWAPATGVVDMLPAHCTEPGIVKICWWALRSELTSIFFGANAIIPFRPGLPDDLAPSTLRYIQPNFADDTTYAGWLSLEEMDLGSWPDQQVIVGGKVKTEFAPLFGDGQQPPPLDALRQAGVDDPVLNNVTDWKSTRQFAARSVPTWKLRQLPSSFLTDVTWVESLASYFGVHWTEGLSRLTTIPQPHLYRFVTAIG